MPHAALWLPAAHWPDSQQPSGQVDGPQGGGAQVPAMQNVVPEQLWQAVPPAPQSASEISVTQVVPLQQPAQVEGSHSHPASAQRWPGAQAAPLPQAQAP